MKFEIRPIEKPRWHGKEKSESFTRPKIYRALVDPNTGEYATGLTKADVTALKKALPNVDLSTQFDINNPHPFWDSSQAEIKLANATMILNDDIPLEKIKISILKANRFIANSMAEYENGDYPDATHVVYSEEEDIQTKASKIEKRNKANELGGKLPKTRKLEIINILGGGNLKNKSNEFIEIAWDKEVMKDAEKVLMYAEKDPKDVAIRSLVKECLDKNVLRKVGRNILYFEDTIGSSVEDVADYLKQEENNEFYIELISKVQ